MEEWCWGGKFWERLRSQGEKPEEDGIKVGSKVGATGKSWAWLRWRCRVPPGTGYRPARREERVITRSWYLEVVRLLGVVS